MNTARGGIVEQPGLIRALKEGKLGSVGLDVTVPEPLPTDSELLKFPNCIVLPHIGMFIDMFSGDHICLK